jgi:hypothetical protein
MIARSRTRRKVRDGRRVDDGERRQVEAVAPNPEEDTDYDGSPALATLSPHNPTASPTSLIPMLG